MSYKIGFDGVVTAQLDKLLQSIESRVNGLGMHVQAATEVGASTVASGSPPCPDGQTCSNGAKGGHDFVVVVAAMVVGAAAGAAAGAVTGFAAGRAGAKGAKGGHD